MRRGPRGMWLPLALLALAGCRREPSFDERYASAQAAISATAAAIDTELAARASEAAALDAPAGGAPSAAPAR